MSKLHLGPLSVRFVVCEVSLKIVMNGAGVCGQDLNRVKDKPYTAAVEDDGRPDHVSNLCVRVCVCTCVM